MFILIGFIAGSSACGKFGVGTSGALIYLFTSESWSASGSTSNDVSASISARLAIGLCVGATLVFGVFPSLVLQFTQFSL
jgi:hypothetical protein